MTTSPDDTGADKFVDLLTAFEPGDVLKHRQCREAVLDFIERSENTFREELFDRIKRPRKRRRRDSGTTNSQTNAEIFFTNQKRIHEETGQGTRQGSPDVQNLLQAVRDLECGTDTSPESYGDSYDQSEGTTPSESIPNRQRSAIAGLDNIERTSHTAEGRRRLRLVRIVYEIDRLQHSAQRVRMTPSGRTVESNIVAAEREFSELSGIHVTRVNTLRTSARSYVNIASQTNGMGLLLMLGSQSRRLWERLSELAFSWLWLFCEEHLQHVIAKAEILQTIACQLVEGDFRQSGAEPTELRQDGHLFSRHFKHLQSGPLRPDPSLRLNTLAMAAEIFDEVLQESSGQGPPRQDNNGFSVVPAGNAATNHVTTVGENGEITTTVPTMVPPMEFYGPFERWEDIMLPFPYVEDWLELSYTDMLNMSST